MGVLEQAFKDAIVMADDIGRVMNLINKLYRMHDALPDDEKQQCWQEISRIAAEQAAKPEISAYTERG